MFDNYNTVSNLLGFGSVPRVIRVTGSSPYPGRNTRFFQGGLVFSLSFSIGGYPNCQDISGVGVYVF